MKYRSNDTDLIERLLGTLRATPNMTAEVLEHEVSKPGVGVDAIVEARLSGNAPVRLLIEAKSSGFPRDVREAAWQLRNYLVHHPSHHVAVPMVIAETISPGARSNLIEENIGYYDTSGSLYLPANNIFLFIDKPTPKPQARSLNSPFLGRRAQVVHAVWVSGENWFSVQEIAQRAGTSPTTASETLTVLEKQDWVISRGLGPRKERRLSNRQGLLDAWTTYQSATRPAQIRQYYVPTSHIRDLLSRLDEASAGEGVNYAVTGVAAAQSYAAHLSVVSQVRCRIAGGLAGDRLLSAINAQHVREGWNLGVIESKTSGGFLFRKRIDGAWFADELQTYLDLLQEGGRSKEMAKHLRDERLVA